MDPLEVGESLGILDRATCAAILKASPHMAIHSDIRNVLRCLDLTNIETAHLLKYLRLDQQHLCPPYNQTRRNGRPTYS